MHTLRACRDALGLSRPKTAALMRATGDRLGIPITATDATLVRMLRGWESGQYSPTDRYRVILAEIYGTTVPALFGTAGAHTPCDPPEKGTGDVNRRAFIGWLSTISAAGAIDSAGMNAALAADVDPQPMRTIGAADVTAIRNATALLAQSDNAYGGAVSRQAVNGQLSWCLAQIDAPATEPVRRALYSAVAELAELAGWMAHDCGAQTQARRLWAIGVQLAARAGDAPVRAYILSSMTRQAVYLGKVADAADYHDAASTDMASYSPALKVEIHNAGARLAGRTGDADGLARTVAAAEDEFTNVNLGNEPAYLGYLTTAQLYGDTGTAYRLLHTATGAGAEQAIERFSTASAGYSAAWQRSRVFVDLERAALLMSSNHRDVAGAVDTVAELLPVLPSLRSARVSDDIRDFRKAAANYRSRSDIRDLDDGLAQLSA